MYKTFALSCFILIMCISYPAFAKCNTFDKDEEKLSQAISHHQSKLWYQFDVLRKNMETNAMMAAMQKDLAILRLAFSPKNGINEPILKN